MERTSGCKFERNFSSQKQCWCVTTPQFPFYWNVVKKEQQSTFTWISTITYFHLLPPSSQIREAGTGKTFVHMQIIGKKQSNQCMLGILRWPQCHRGWGRRELPTWLSLFDHQSSFSPAAEFRDTRGKTRGKMRMFMCSAVVRAEARTRFNLRENVALFLKLSTGESYRTSVWLFTSAVNQIIHQISMSSCSPLQNLRIEVHQSSTWHERLASKYLVQCNFLWNWLILLHNFNKSWFERSFRVESGQPQKYVKQKDFAD